jgi:hypothetical protein
MADIKIGRLEIREYGMPPCCLRCGARTHDRILKTFVWNPLWFFGEIILWPMSFLIESRRVEYTMEIPLCTAHRQHWAWQKVIVAAQVLGLWTAGVVAFGLSSERNPLLVWIIAIVNVVCPLLLVGPLAKSTAIRAVEITSQSITLTGVSDKFASTLNKIRGGGEPDERDERPVRPVFTDTIEFRGENP